jgi:hypothetical protein
VKLIKLDEGDEIAGITNLQVEDINGNGNGHYENGDGAKDDSSQATDSSANSSEESTEQ